MSDDKKKVFQMVRGGESPDEFKDALQGMRDQFTDMVEFFKIDAQYKKAKYDAFVEEGFTPEQALFLTKGALIEQ